MELLKAVLPVLITLLTGMLLREKNLISVDGISGLQSLVMNVTLPVALFSNFYKTSLSADELILPLTMFVVVVGGLFLGRMLCMVFKQNDPHMPFVLCGYEAGMLGYALMAILAGNITAFAILDIGHSIAIFTVYLALLKASNGEKQSVRDAFKGIITTPVLVAILLGVIFGMSGIGGKLAETSAGPVIDQVCAFMSAPTSAAILIVIGYRMRFSGLDWSKALRVCMIRILETAFFAAAVLGLFSLIGGNLTARLTVQSLVLMLILPPPYILPLYVEGENKKEFYSSVLSVYTLFSIIGFFIMVAVSLA